MEILLTLILVVVWFGIYKFVHAIMKHVFAGSNYPELYANLVAIPWPITVPLGLLFVLFLAIFRSEH